MDFSFALALLGGQTEIKLQTDVKLRDPVIRYVLDLFDGAPVKIFQVGGIESLQTQFRWGSGWSDTIFGAYIKEKGGSLTIADVDLDHLANSSFMAERLGYDLLLELGDAIEFKKIEETKSVVLIDDIKSKAVSLTKYLKSKNIRFETHHGFGNGGMITIDMRQR